MTRRSLFQTSLVAATAAAATAQSRPDNIVVASHNGLECCRRAHDMLRKGEDTLDAVVAGVNIVELDPDDTSVGYGGLPNEHGDVELDSCVMHGPTRRAGSVASIRGIKTPSKVAQLVLERSDHVMMVADGALQFAKAHGFKEEDLLTDRARLAWLRWKESQGSDWGPGLDAPAEAKDGSALLKQMPGAKREWLAWADEVVANPPTGTINCLSLNAKGEMSGVTTTSGLAWKIPGRVGDSPIIGAGLYVDQDVGGAGSTGRGEENIRVCGAHSVVENMRHGMSAQDACLDVLKRISRNYNDDMEKIAQFDIFFYALRKDGDFASASMWSSKDGGKRDFAVNTGGKSRHEKAEFLYKRKA